MTESAHIHPMLTWAQNDAMSFVTGIGRLYGGVGHVYGPVKEAESAMHRAHTAVAALRDLADRAEAGGLPRPVDDRILNLVIDADVQIYQCMKRSAENTRRARHRHRNTCSTMRRKVDAAAPCEALEAVRAVQSAANDSFTILEQACIEDLAIADTAGSINVGLEPPDERCKENPIPNPLIMWVERNVCPFLRAVTPKYGVGDPLKLSEHLRASADLIRELAAKNRTLAREAVDIGLDRVIPGIEASEARLACEATRLADIEFHLYQTMRPVSHDVKKSRVELRKINLALLEGIAKAKEDGDVVALIAKAREAVDRTFNVIASSLALSAHTATELEEIIGFLGNEAEH